MVSGKRAICFSQCVRDDVLKDCSIQGLIPPMFELPMPSILSIYPTDSPSSPAKMYQVPSLYLELKLGIYKLVDKMLM